MDNDKKTLRAENLSYSYVKGQKVLSDINISVSPGKITALLGANGCGKTTLFHLLTGRLKPTDGTVCFGNKSIESIKRREFSKRIAVVHQYNTAPDDITVRKLVAMGRTPYQNMFSYGQNDEDRKAVETALEVTDTEKFSERTISQLSGGQKQRVWLAMALAQSCDILLLDEITTYLDIRYQLEILSLLKKLNKERELTVFMVMHDINQALEFSEETVFMNGGKILAHGATSEVITKDILDQAFNIDTEIISVHGHKHCLFGRKEKHDI